MTKQRTYDLEEQIRGAYRECMEGIGCPKGLQERIIRAVEEKDAEQQVQQEEGGNLLQFGKQLLCKKTGGSFDNVAGVVMAVLCVALFLHCGRGIVYAVELFISQGVTYEAYAGKDNITKIWFNLADWNVDKEQTAGDLEEWQQYYPEFYSQLEKQGALDVMLPHYGMGEYEWQQGLAYAGELAEGDVVLDAVFVKDDSQYLVSISKLQNATHTAFTHALAEHYAMEVNDITYEVFKINQDQTYEEYCAIMEQELGARFSYLGEKEYEEWKKHPVYLKTMVNGWDYTFALSEDIVIEEFLESIY